MRRRLAPRNNQSHAIAARRSGATRRLPIGALLFSEPRTAKLHPSDMTSTPPTSHRPENGQTIRTLEDAVDAAAATAEGLNFYSGKGVLVEALSYADLRTQAQELARRLLNAGLVHGDRVAMVADTEADFVRIFFACTYAGLVPAPMPLPAAFGGKDNYLAHIRRMVERADARAAFAPAALKEWLHTATEGLPLKLVGTIDDIRALDPVGGDLPEVAENDLCYLQFSSGSTRFPMGIAVTQKALVANATAIYRYGLQAGPGDRCVSWLPFYHDMGLVGFLLTPIVARISVDYFATRDFARRPLLWLDLISRNRGTISYSPSFGYELSVQRAEKMTLPEGLDLSSWRTAGIGGDMIRPEVLRRFGARFAEFGFKTDNFVPSYGMAEATLALSFAPLGNGMQTTTVDAERMEHEGIIVDADGDDRRSREFMLCGIPLPGHEIVVRDPDGSPAAPRTVGRIYARGPSLMTAYFNEPEATAAVLSDDGWLDTGDLGYFEGEQIVITGRAKDLVIVNGRNIWPQDLEWTAESHIESLRSGDVAVFSVDAEASEHIVALVQCRTADPEKRKALCDEVMTVLRVECGAVVEVVPVGSHDLPVTSSGKLSRTKARALYHQLMRDAAASA